MDLATRDADTAFAELICADAQWLREEFDALVAASFGEPPAAPPLAPPRVPPSPGPPGPPIRGQPSAGPCSRPLPRHCAGPPPPALTSGVTSRARQPGQREL